MLSNEYFHEEWVEVTKGKGMKISTAKFKLGDKVFKTDGLDRLICTGALGAVFEVTEVIESLRDDGTVIYLYSVRTNPTHSAIKQSRTTENSLVAIEDAHVWVFDRISFFTKRALDVIRSNDG